MCADKHTIKQFTLVWDYKPNHYKIGWAVQSSDEEMEEVPEPAEDLKDVIAQESSEEESSEDDEDTKVWACQV